MSTLFHRKFRSEVHLLADGELDADRITAVCAHLSDCENCRDDLRWWLAIRDGLRRNPGPHQMEGTSAPTGSPQVRTDGEDRSLGSLAAPLSSLAIALGWVLLATWRPTTTYHFGPLLVTVAWPYVARSRIKQPMNRSETVTALAGGAAISLVTTLGLYLGNRLEGPTFWESPDAPLEAVLMTLLGVLWGLRVATRRRGGLLSSADQL